MNSFIHTIYGKEDGEMFYESIIRPLLFGISKRDPEIAHRLALASLQLAGNIGVLRWLLTQYTRVESPHLRKEVFGLTFPNPIGLAAGFDKDGVALPGLVALGFGHVELGTVTAFEQQGKARPRIWRFPEEEALINDMGFNNQGAVQLAMKLRKAGKVPVPIGVNIGKSQAVPAEDLEAVAADYRASLMLLYERADYIAINVSSPNTAGLRTLQGKEQLAFLLQNLLEEAQGLSKGAKKKPMLVKVAPDLSLQALEDVLSVCTDCGIDGIIATNATTSREGLLSSAPSQGGMSGAPLRRKTLRIVEHIHQQAPSLPIIGVGGVSHLKDVLQLFSAGASLVQVYTGFVYQGPFLVRRLNSGLKRRDAERLAASHLQ